jgi:ABC-type dipeptide/oligopeptide/nickel transport system permease component
VRLGTDPGDSRLLGGGGDGVRLAGIGTHRHPGHRADDLISAPGHRLTVAIMVVLINIVLDIIYKAIDPRLKLT